ncbi:MAG: hypothetical protein LBG89_01265 [Rickettsiales bacterium]|jgi:hypothetical protein|nr:hypothetical protein [Rickettsiales bacterium]
MFDAKWFFDLEKRLIEAGLDSDLDSFAVIKKRLGAAGKFSPDEFARQAAYVVLAGGFSQKTAKKIHVLIMEALRKGAPLSDLFGNANKTKAIQKIWDNREKYRDEYYKREGLENKLVYLATLPHIGKITANHLARNLGEDIVKYDVWIVRLGEKFPGGADAMFAHLVRETGLPRGYIDVVLWKSMQQGFIK